MINLNDTPEPINKSQLDNAQSTVANRAMDGILPTDINQNNAKNNDAPNSSESLLDMLHDSKNLE